MQTENGQKKNKYEIDMTNGTLMDKLISFSLPLMLSGILQLMFNAVDIIVVGQIQRKPVHWQRSVRPLHSSMYLPICLSEFHLGANVLAARFYAAGREKEMSETVHTAIALALDQWCCHGSWWVLFLPRGALELMGTPA